MAPGIHLSLFPTNVSVTSLITCLGCLLVCDVDRLLFVRAQCSARLVFLAGRWSAGRLVLCCQERVSPQESWLAVSSPALPLPCVMMMPSCRHSPSHSCTQPLFPLPLLLLSCAPPPGCTRNVDFHWTSVTAPGSPLWNTLLDFMAACGRAYGRGRKSGRFLF
jgi:hypothetical protein